jgi:predicted acyltransferase
MATRALDYIAAAPSTRIISLDVFRGITMAAMMIVNNPGDWNNVYAPLLHAEWHGWTPTDLIFPFFLFIVGVAITLSRKSTSWGSILRRTAIIFALGLFLNGFPHFDLSTWRIPGVLQRIAVCYLFAAAAFKLTTPVAQASGPASQPLRPAIILSSLAFILMVLYWFILTFVPAPGGVVGDLSPEGNVGAWLDRTLMSGHLWRPRWDPEGFLSTIPAIATTLLGVVVGLWLGSAQSPSKKAAGLLMAGVIAIIAGQAWNVIFPINKNIWTSSFVLFTAGAAAVLLAGCYWLIDVKGWRAWTLPFVILGANAITLYVISGLLADTLGTIMVSGDRGLMSLGRFIFREFFASLASPKNASLLYAFANLAVLFAILTVMYRKKWFLRV